MLSQQRFTYLPDESAAGQLWQVPVQVRVQTRTGTTAQRVLLTEAEARLPLPADARAVLVNEGGHGFYRVRYAPELRERLLALLPHGLAPVERFNLVNDAWATVLAALMPLPEYLDLTARFRDERDKNVWSVLIGSFQALNRVVDAADRPRLAALVRDRLAGVMGELGWQPQPGEDELTGQLRGEVVRALGMLGNDPDVQTRAGDVFAQAGSTTSPAVDANLLAAVIPVLAHVGDAERYEDFVQRFRTARSPQEEQRYLMALACFQPAPLVEQTLALTLNGEVRTQDAPFLLRSLFYNVAARERAWQFLQANWERMNREYPVTGVRRMLEGLTALATPEWEQQVRDFCHARQVHLGGKTLEQYLEQLHIAVRLREREGRALHEYLWPKI